MADTTGHVSLSSEESPATGLTGLFLLCEMTSCFGIIWPQELMFILLMA